MAPANRKTLLFQDKVVPAETSLAGWAALAAMFEVKAPVRSPSVVSNLHVRGSRVQRDEWQVFDKRYQSGETWEDHLTFALKHEALDLVILKRVCESLTIRKVEQFVKATPTGVVGRRLWYYFELLTGQTLRVEDVPKTATVELIDPAAYFTGQPRFSKRQRINDNLLGTGAFCPLIRRTSTLEQFGELALAEKVRKTIARTRTQLVARAASFMLLADSRASFEIEGERPPQSRLERWGRAILQSGKHRLSLDEIIRLHHLIIEDDRFTQPGLRSDGVFLGERDWNGDPMPEFIGARPKDLAQLVDGLLEANERMRDDKVDPVLHAAATAFGFVFVHPLQDGNGRIHRCLIHHVLAEREFTPPRMVFPVSSVMLDRIDVYRKTLQSHTGPLMPFIEWRPTPARNVEVLNDTADLYRYFDCTAAAEFLYACVAHTVDVDLPREIDYLRRHESALNGIMNTVGMPNQVAENLMLFIRQNKGTLPKARRRREFAKLTDDEVTEIEAIVREAFDGFGIE